MNSDATDRADMKNRGVEDSDTATPPENSAGGLASTPSGVPIWAHRAIRLTTFCRAPASAFGKPRALPSRTVRLVPLAGWQTKCGSHRVSQDVRSRVPCFRQRKHALFLHSASFRHVHADMNMPPARSLGLVPFIESLNVGWWPWFMSSEATESSWDSARVLS